jgi:hypothetical protein
MIRKIFITSLLMAGLFGGTAEAQGDFQQAKFRALAKSSYLWCLSSEHPAIRNSAVFRVMQYRMSYPQEDMQPFVKALREMSLKDASSQNRLYAFLACTYLENENLLKAAGAPPEFEDEKQAYFTHLQRILQDDVAVAKE